MNTLKRISKVELNSTSGKRKFALDITYMDDSQAKPVVLFVHGFKGFKDWGPFPLLADFFAEKGYILVKFNFSHNGTTPEHPVDFEDLEAFGKNRYSYEMNEIGDVLDFIDDQAFPIPQHQVLNSRLLIGHSRGGGICIAKAREDSRITALATLASVGNLAPWNEEILNTWKEKGVLYIHNGRTQQEMPLYYSLVEDYHQHIHKLDLSKIAPQLTIPWLIIHGGKDETVPCEQGKMLHELNSQSEWLLLNNAGHTFDGQHPFHGNTLPEDLKTALEAIHHHFHNTL